MMVVFDNNIILDALLERKPFSIEAEQLLAACASEHLGYLTANSLTDIFYVISKFAGAINAKQTVKKLADLFEIIPVSGEDCINALELPIDDFEDALIITCTARCGADCIITRNEKLLNENSSPVMIMSPQMLLDKLK